jgi:hypothetical protein
MLGLGTMLAPAERAAKASGEPVRIVLETTTNARAIQRMLLEYGREAGIDLTARVLDARKLRVIAESVSKCDALDAKVLNERGRADLRLAVPRVPVYGDLFDRIERKKDKATAIVAVARRMLEDAYTMLKRDQTFRYVAVPWCGTHREVPVRDTSAGDPQSGRKVASSVAG